MFLLLIIFNQFGSFYFNYPINNQHLKVKANLLKYFSHTYFHKINVKDSLYELENITSKSVIYKWQIIDLDSVQFYYLLPPMKIEALDNFVYFVNRQNIYFQRIEISMSIDPDSTSDVSFYNYSALCLNKKFGKIHFPVSLSIHERGLYIMNLILHEQLSMFVIINSTDTIMFKNENDFMVDLNSNLHL
jgi:hypothetical protein